MVVVGALNVGCGVVFIVVVGALIDGCGVV